MLVLDCDNIFIFTIENPILLDLNFFKQSSHISYTIYIINIRNISSTEEQPLLFPYIKYGHISSYALDTFEAENVLLWFFNIFIANILKRNQIVFSWYHFFVHSNFWHILFGVKITHFSLLQEILRILISLKLLRMYYLNDKTINFITIFVVKSSLVILSFYHFRKKTVN